jgi:hypothetical protein
MILDLQSTRTRLALLLAAAALAPFALSWRTGAVRAQVAVRKQGYVPFSDAPIHYLSDNLTDPVARLQKRLDAGQTTLRFEGETGYLRSILQQLNIPVSSQTLVFSKTSFQYKKISPQTPRALYFNDDVYVGYVHDGKALEVVSFDPMQGAIFYLLDVRPSEKPVFQRAELDCTQCHIANGTRNVPGVLLRSIVPGPTGTQVLRTSSSVTGQETPLKDRWGGWYVTGTSGDQVHMGNSVVTDTDHPESFLRAAGTNITDISMRIDPKNYLSAQSDIVAHLVLAHQTQMHNLITLTNYQTRIALDDAAKANIGTDATKANPYEAQKQWQEPAEELVRYLLFANETPLTGPIEGTSGFTREFAARGPRDRLGRSLRDFDLHTRIFRYPCSYLIYSESFDSLPEPAKQFVYHRIFQVLTGQDHSEAFARLSAQDRKNILDILLATKPGLPDEWTQNSKRAQHTPQKHPSADKQLASQTFKAIRPPTISTASQTTQPTPSTKGISQ